LSIECLTHTTLFPYTTLFRSFRSQRQLIIDTERLIAEKPVIPKQEFNARSNELGFDQKSLRLKYGQFMGDETEIQAPPGGVVQGDRKSTRLNSSHVKSSYAVF